MLLLMSILNPTNKQTTSNYFARRAMSLKMTIKLWCKSSSHWWIRSCNNSCNMVLLTSCNMGHILEICCHMKHHFGCIVSITCGGFCGYEDWVFDEAKHIDTTVVLYSWSFPGYSGCGIIRKKRDSTLIRGKTPMTVVQGMVLSRIQVFRNQLCWRCTIQSIITQYARLRRQKFCELEKRMIRQIWLIVLRRCWLYIDGVLCVNSSSIEEPY